MEKAGPAQTTQSIQLPSKQKTATAYTKISQSKYPFSWYPLKAIMFVTFQVCMKRLRWGWLLTLCMILSACPFESTVPMEPRPVEAVDSSLIGYWYGIIKDGSDYFGIEALEISRQSDSVYTIIRYGKAIKGDMVLPDTAYFTGYTSWIGTQQFMNVEGSVTIDEGTRKKPLLKKQKVFYISAFAKKNDTLDVRTLTESFSARKYFNSSEEFKKLVTEMLARQRNIYDEQYSLKYRKIPKPQQIFPSN
jgi:hypothetical protein